MTKTKNRKKYSILLTLIVIFGVIISMAYFFPDLFQQKGDYVNRKEYTNPTYDPTKHYKNITLEVDFNNGTIDIHTNLVISQNESSVFEILNKFYDLGFETYSYGKIITSIDDVANNVQTNQFWFFWLNQEYSNLGATTVFIDDDDVIVWKYRNANDVTEF